MDYRSAVSIFTIKRFQHDIYQDLSLANYGLIVNRARKK